MQASELPLRVADLVSSLSYALDLTEGPESMGRAVRTCLVGMRLAAIIQLPDTSCADLYYALLLKDAGVSNSASRTYQIFGHDDVHVKRDMRSTDWARLSPAHWRFVFRHAAPREPLARRIPTMIQLGLRGRRHTSDVVHLRCERGAAIVRKMGFSERTADAILCMDEHWDGRGSPRHLQGEEIPLLAGIVNIAQFLEASVSRRGVAIAFAKLTRRSGKWFDPRLVRAARAMKNDLPLWDHFHQDTLQERVMDLDPGSVLHADFRRVDEICEAFADVIDAKTHFTYEHSRGVASAALAIAQRMQLDERTVQTLRRAALLHDIGKLSVSNAILEKPGKLSPIEWETVRLHPYYTHRILERIAGFQEIAFIASAHHERLDGTGYYRNLQAEHLSPTARILAVADVFDALHAERPYRKGLPTEVVLRIMEKDAPHALDADCVRALREVSLAHAQG